MSAILQASPSPITLAPIHNTFALLCCFVASALKQSLLDHIMALREEGTTVLFVEHDINMVRHIADWVTVMAEGKIVAEGQPKSVMNDPAVIDAYLGAHANVDLGDDSVLEDLKEA